MAKLDDKSATMSKKNTLKIGTGGKKEENI